MSQIPADDAISPRLAIGYVANQRSPITQRIILGLEKFVIFALALVILWSRMPDRLHGFLWAEDGVIFTSQAYSNGVASILLPYAGYLHVLPRIIAWIYSHVGQPEGIPKAFVWASACLTASATAYIGAVARRHLSFLAALSLALTPLLILHTGEVWLSITNLQWVMAPVVAVTLWDMVITDTPMPVRGIASVAKTSPLLILMMTGPFGVLFSMLSIGAVLLRSASDRAIARANWIPVIIGLAIQGSIILFCPDRYRIRPTHSIHDFSEFPWFANFIRFVVTDFLGAPALPAGRPFVWVLVTCLMIAAGLVMLKLTDQRWRMTVMTLLATALALWVLGVVRSDNPQMDVQVMMRGNRYSYLPFVFAAWALIIIAATATNIWAKIIAMVIVGAVMFNSIESWRCEQIPIVRIDHVDNGVFLFNMPPSIPWNFVLNTRR